MAAKKDYTKAVAKTAVVTIEAVVSIEDAPLMEEHITSALESLQCHGAADVIRREYVAETFEEAVQILSRKAVR